MYRHRNRPHPTLRCWFTWYSSCARSVNWYIHFRFPPCHASLSQWGVMYMVPFIVTPLCPIHPNTTDTQFGASFTSALNVTLSPHSFFISSLSNAHHFRGKLSKRSTERCEV